MNERLAMSQRFGDVRLFLGEFRRTFRTTGAVLPSGRALARALARHVRLRDGVVARHVLEVGPGTGAVTAEIVPALGPLDRLDLVELNERFVASLRRRFDGDPLFDGAGARARIIQGRVEELPAGAAYDVIVSGLPLNNFAVAEVEQILGQLLRLLRPGGVLSFFEYIAVRRAKAALSGRTERKRLRGIEQALAQVFRLHETSREWVLRNVPPAWVHHVCVCR